MAERYEPTGPARFDQAGWTSLPDLPVHHDKSSSCLDYALILVLCCVVIGIVFYLAGPKIAELLRPLILALGGAV